jgi:hypothetical protein
MLEVDDLVGGHLDFGLGEVPLFEEKPKASSLAHPFYLF